MAGQGLWELALPSADRSHHLSSVQGKARGVSHAHLTLVVLVTPAHSLWVTGVGAKPT